MNVINIDLRLSIAKSYFNLKKFSKSLEVLKRMGELSDVSESDVALETKLQVTIESLYAELEKE